MYACAWIYNERRGLNVTPHYLDENRKAKNRTMARKTNPHGGERLTSAKSPKVSGEYFVSNYRVSRVVNDERSSRELIAFVNTL